MVIALFADDGISRPVVRLSVVHGLVYFTKARYLKRIDQGYQYHAKKADHPNGLKDHTEWRPWYDEVTHSQGKVYFGHWAILAGQTGHPSCVLLMVVVFMADIY